MKGEGKMRNLTQKQQMGLEMCLDWNSKYPVGTKVLLTDDTGNEHETVTTSEAGMLGGHTPVIWTEFKPCYLLTRIKAIQQGKAQ
jgi:hypothetical protein